jgi:hypothetical protein
MKRRSQSWIGTWNGIYPTWRLSMLRPRAWFAGGNGWQGYSPAGSGHGIRFSFEVTEILGHGEQVFLAGQQVGRGRHSGVDVSVPTFHVCTLRDRRIVVMRTFPDRAAALEAAGLEE